MSDAKKESRWLPVLALVVFCTLVAVVICCLLSQFAHFTRFSDGFDERLFRTIAVGDEAGQVIEKLGQPIIKVESEYPARFVYLPEGIVKVEDAEGKILELEDPQHVLESRGISNPSYKNLTENFGYADEVSPAYNYEEWHYSENTYYLNHKRRIVIVDVDSGRVVGKVSDYYFAPWN